MPLEDESKRNEFSKNVAASIVNELSKCLSCADDTEEKKQDEKKIYSSDGSEIMTKKNETSSSSNCVEESESCT